MFDEEHKKTTSIKVWKKTLFISVFSVSILLSVYYYRLHMYWFYMKYNLDIQNIKAIPVTVISKNVDTDGWLQCQEGSVAFKLPSELYTNKMNAAGDKDCIIFFGKEGGVFCIPPLHISDYKRIPGFTSLLQNLTVPMMYRESYSAGSDDFRWSMTPKEVALFLRRISWRLLGDRKRPNRCEWLQRPDLDIFVLFTDKRTVVYWQNKKNNLVSFFDFRFADTTTNTTVLVHGFCNSLTALDINNTNNKK